MTDRGYHDDQHEPGDFHLRGRALWCAVIKQALADTRSNNLRHRNAARTWLTTNSPDFRHICEMAELNPDTVRAYAEKQIEQGGESAPKRVTHKARLVTHDGITRPIAEWSEATGIPANILHMRLFRLGWTPAEALTKPVAPRGYPAKLITHNGITRTLAEWSEATGIPIGTINSRLLQGWPTEQALNPGKLKRPRGRVSRTLTHDGLTMTAVAWATHLGITPAGLSARLKTMTQAEALSRPARRPTPGEGSDFQGAKETGGRSVARECAEIEFSMNKDLAPCP